MTWVLQAGGTQDSETGGDKYLSCLMCRPSQEINLNLMSFLGLLGYLCVHDKGRERERDRERDRLQFSVS